MDLTLAAAAVAGVLAGFAASVVPGLHVNALAAATLALAPWGGAPGAAFLVAAFAASPFGYAVSSAVVGPSSDEDALGALPAQRLAAEGRAAEAIALQAWGALAGLAVALPLALALAPALGRGAGHLRAATPWLLLAVLVALVLSERARPPVHRTRLVVPWKATPLRGPLARRPLRVGRRRVLDPHALLDAHAEGEEVEVHVEHGWEAGPLSSVAGRASALAVVLLSGALGLAAFTLGARSPLGWPASPLLPLLAGLFALPALARMATRPAPRVRARLRAPRVRLRQLARDIAPGAAASSLLGLLPGVSPSHVGLLLPRADEPERALVRIGAIGGGAVVFTLLAWHLLGRARSGALVAAEALAPPPAWLGAAPPPAVLAEAALVLGAGAAALVLARLAGRAVGRAPLRPIARGGLALLVVAVALGNGALGLLELAVAGLVGELPARLGVRRSHAMGVILVPALLATAGLR